MALNDVKWLLSKSLENKDMAIEIYIDDNVVIFKSYTPVINSLV